MVFDLVSLLRMVLNIYLEPSSISVIYIINEIISKSSLKSSHLNICNCQFYEEVLKEHLILINNYFTKQHEYRKRQLNFNHTCR